MEDCMHHVLGLGVMKLSFLESDQGRVSVHKVKEELFYLTQSHPS